MLGSGGTRVSTQSNNNPNNSIQTEHCAETISLRSPCTSINDHRPPRPQASVLRRGSWPDLMTRQREKCSSQLAN